MLNNNFYCLLVGEIYIIKELNNTKKLLKEVDVVHYSSEKLVAPVVQRGRWAVSFF